MRAVYAAAFERHWGDATPGRTAARAGLCAFETAFAAAMSAPSADKEDGEDKGGSGCGGSGAARGVARDGGEGGEEDEEGEEGEATKGGEGAVAKLSDYLVACGGVRNDTLGMIHPFGAL